MSKVAIIGGKTSDMFFASTDEYDFDGYVPRDLGIGGGDIIEIAIDIETGKIIGWDKDQFLAWIKEKGTIE